MASKMKRTGFIRILVYFYIFYWIINIRYIPITDYNYNCRIYSEVFRSLHEYTTEFVCDKKLMVRFVA